MILTVLSLINDYINKHHDNANIPLSICNILLLLFYLIGSIVYLEFIELNFCKLNFYLRRNIKDRADSDFKLSFLELEHQDTFLD